MTIENQYENEKACPTPYYLTSSSALTVNPMTHSPTPTVDAYTDKFGTNELDTQHDVELSSPPSPSLKKRRRRMENRNCCIRYLCCACCLPLWASCILWFIIIAIIIVIIVLGAIAGTFIMPTVNLVGVSASNITQQVSFSESSININFGLIVSINNPNLLSIDLSNLVAIAYYPSKTGNDIQIGSGYLASQYVPKYSHFNFTFPFAIQYIPSEDSDQSVLNDLATKCGLTGSEPQDLTIDYKIHLTAKVLMIKVHPTISSSATFPCPIASGGNLGDFNDDGFDL